jgi:hypothetical protein
MNAAWPGDWVRKRRQGGKAGALEIFWIFDVYWARSGERAYILRSDSGSTEDVIRHEQLLEHQLMEGFEILKRNPTYADRPCLLQARGGSRW